MLLCQTLSDPGISTRTAIAEYIIFLNAIASEIECSLSTFSGLLGAGARLTVLEVALHSVDFIRGLIQALSRQKTFLASSPDSQAF